MLDVMHYYTEAIVELDSIQKILQTNGYKKAKIVQVPGDKPQLSFSFKLVNYPNTKGYLRWYKSSYIDLSSIEKLQVENLGIKPETEFYIRYRTVWKTEMLMIMKIVLTQLGGCLLPEDYEEFYTLSNLDKLETSLPDH